MKELGLTKADLARESGVSKPTITELLNGTRDSCVDLPKIYRALEWPWHGSLPLVSQDAGELLGIWDHLNDFEKGRLLERARSIYETQRVTQRRRGES